MKAELIEGVVVLSPPVLFREGRALAAVTGWLGYYLSHTPGLEEYGRNVTVRLDEANVVQPDLVLLLPERLGGAARVDEDDYIVGPPTLACKVAGSTVSIDLHAKMEAYRRNGVREYLVWRVEDGAVDWFALREGGMRRCRGMSGGW